MGYLYKAMLTAFITVVFLSTCKLGAQDMTNEFQSRSIVQDQVTNLFVYTDQHQWEKLKGVFAETVLLDYSSFTGQAAAELTPDQIIGAWSGFLPGFKSTHHQIGNVLVKINGEKASVFVYGTASHYFPNDVVEDLWLVVGSYDFELVKNGDTWKVSSMTFNFKYQDGNTDLPKLIQNENKE